MSIGGTVLFYMFLQGGNPFIKCWQYYLHFWWAGRCLGSRRQPESGSGEDHHNHMEWWCICIFQQDLQDARWKAWECFWLWWRLQRSWVCRKGLFKDFKRLWENSTKMFVCCDVTANWYGQAASNLPQVIEETHEFWLKLVGVQQPTLEPGSLCTSTVWHPHMMTFYQQCSDEEGDGGWWTKIEINDSHW